MARSRHGASRRSLAALLGVAAAAWGCRTTPAPAPTDAAGIHGTWVGSDGSVLTFVPGGRARWVLATPQAASDTFHVSYQVQPGPDGTRLDLLNFDRGMLRGRVLYCLADLASAPGVMRMDCEPGNSAQSDRRPARLTAQTREYVKRP